MYIDNLDYSNSALKVELFHRPLRKPSLRVWGLQQLMTRGFPGQVPWPHPPTSHRPLGQMTGKVGHCGILAESNMLNDIVSLRCLITDLYQLAGNTSVSK